MPMMSELDSLKEPDENFASVQANEACTTAYILAVQSTRIRTRHLRLCRWVETV